MTAHVEVRGPVLVLDDEPDMRASYDRLLRRLGYRVIQAESRHEGLALVEALPLLLVISDLKLRDGSGLDVVSAARDRPIRVPSIVVTAFLSPDSRHAAFAAGASGFLAKPFAAADFAALVERVVSAPR